MFKINTSKSEAKVPKILFSFAFAFLILISLGTYYAVLIDEINPDSAISTIIQNQNDEQTGKTNIFGQPIGNDTILDQAQIDENKMLAIGYASGVFTVGLIFLLFITYKLRPKDIPEEDTVYQDD